MLFIVVVVAALVNSTIEGGKRKGTPELTAN
jgi:hypothetical protein